MNTTACPLHTVVAGVVIATNGVTEPNMVMVTAFDVAGLLVAQAALEVSTQVITSLLAGLLST